MQWVKTLGLLGALLGGVPLAFVALFVPVSYLAIDGSCAVTGFLPSLQASIRGERFWAKQLEILDTELARPSEADAIAQLEIRSAQIEEDLYRSYPDLRPSPREQEAELLRRRAEVLTEQADALEFPKILALEQEATQQLELERLRQHKFLRTCRPTIQARSLPLSHR